MAQIPSQVYTKAAQYQYSIDGPINALSGTNLGIVLNPGEFVMGGYFKVTNPFTSPNPTDLFAVGIVGPGSIGGTIIMFQPQTTAQLNVLVGSWRTMQWASQPADFGAFCPQPTAPPGTPSNTFFRIVANSGIANTGGSIAICMLIGSTAL